MEKPLPILVQQPPIQGTNQLTVVNFTQTKESPWEQMQALVPIMPYEDKTSSSSSDLVETQGCVNYLLCIHLY